MPRAKKVTDEMYHLLLEYGSEQFAGKGATLAEAFADMDKPKKVYRGGVMVLRHGEKTIAKVMGVPILKRIFTNKIHADQWVKIFKDL